MNILQLARLDDSRTCFIIDGAGLGPGSLNGLDDVHGLLISNLTKDHMAAVQPVSSHGGDEEL